MIWSDKDLGDSPKTLQRVHSVTVANSQWKQRVREESTNTAGDGASGGHTLGQGYSNNGVIPGQF